MHNFRMLEADFDALFEIVEPHLQHRRPSRASAGSMRSYFKRHQLLATLHFLAHCPTLLQCEEKFGWPHSSLSKCCIHPCIKAIVTALFRTAATKNVVFPQDAAGQKAIAEGFYDRFELPGCVGAIDGTFIAQQKPSKKQTWGDTDSYWCYKGFCSTLLLAVCDANLVFRYVYAGTPGNVGDAGLYARSGLKELIDDGMLRKWHVDAPGLQQELFP
jgi:hypothetical protein